MFRDGAVWLYSVAPHLHSIVLNLPESSFCLARLAVRYLNRYLPNPIPCVLDKPEVLVKDTEQPRFLPWEFQYNSERM